MLKTGEMDAASVVDLTRLSACAPVLREMMQLSVVRGSVGRCADAELARQYLANGLIVVRGQRDDALYSLALERRERAERDLEILLREEEIARLNFKVQELLDENIAIKKEKEKRIVELLEEHSVVLEERIAESREKGARVIELLGEKVAVLEEQTRLRGRVLDLELELAVAKRARV